MAIYLVSLSVYTYFDSCLVCWSGKLKANWRKGKCSTSSKSYVYVHKPSLGKNCYWSLRFTQAAISKIGRVCFSMLAFKSKWTIPHLQKIGQILRRRVFDSHPFSSSCVFVFSIPILFPLRTFPCILMSRMRMSWLMLATLALLDVDKDGDCHVWSTNLMMGKARRSKSMLQIMAEFRL